jgi:hypothetical protein
MFKRLLVGATLGVALFSIALSGQTAIAASIYDDVYRHTDSVIISTPAWSPYYTSCSPIDYTLTISSAITEALSNNSRNNNNTDAATYLESWENALSGGRWTVSQSTKDNGEGHHYKQILINWTEDDSLALDWTSNPTYVVATGNGLHSIILRPKNVMVGGSSCDAYALLGTGVEVSNDGSGAVPVESLFVYSDHLNYPSGYAGTSVVGNTDTDLDGLNIAQESIQGTSDSEQDTDSDGLDDYVESQWYPDRDDVFCGSQCAYADPVVKDIYVEIDWMDDGTNEYKPTSTQLGLVEGGLDDRGYNVHIDTGQYGGGGELSDYIEYLPLTFGANPVGFFDLKNGNISENVPANFSSDRQGIWRYLISGYGVGEDHDLSGGSYAGSDNILIATGYIYDHPGFGYNDVDVAIAGTIVHELGHSLCMSKLQSYSYQSTDCRYSGVDTAAASTYDSVLNYNLQMLQTNLSNGSNGMGDHNDWGAIDGGGIADFGQWNTSEAEPGVNLKKTKPTKPVMKRGISLEQAQAAKRNGTLGIVTRNGKTYDLKKKNGSNLP